MPESSRTVYIVPHTHWDREWYEPFEIFRAQLVQLWDQLLSLTEGDPDFRFLMDGQSVVIDDYLQIRPEARSRLERAVRSGQIQVGPWYTLPDEFLVSGETLVRDLQRGLADANRHGGSMRVGYLPDSFGHAAQMPQIYAQLGFRYAAIWRGVPLSIDRVAFVWQAPDGSRVLTAYMGNSYAHGVNLPIEAAALTTRISSALQAIEPFRPTRDVLLMNGNDHVLPQAALAAAVREASAAGNGTVLRLARLDDYLQALPEDSWPLWQGELRSSARANVLMGTLSVRVPDKQLYACAGRRLERLAEPLAALTATDVGDRLASAWTMMLQNAAHDTACGSGIDAVADAARRRSESALTSVEGIVERCLPLIAGWDELWNPSPFPRQDVVDTDSGPVLTSVIPGCSAAAIRGVEPVHPVLASDTRLDNGQLRVTLRPDGTVDVLHFPTGVSYVGLARVADEADAGDEYNFSPAPELDASPLTIAVERPWEILERTRVRCRAAIHLRCLVPATLTADRRRRSVDRVSLPVRLQVSLEADSARVDFEADLENHARDHRLRLHFPLPFTPSVSAADTAFHVTRRPVVGLRRDPGSPEVELPTYPMRSFVDVSHGGAGMALITDGLHEYEVLPQPLDELALTLLRAVGWLSREDLTTRTGHAGPGLETPGAQVLGSHRFRFSLYFHPGDWRSGNTWRAAESALLPLMRGAGEPHGANAPVVELEPECVQLTACVPTAGGFDLRIVNAADEPTAARVLLQPRPRAVTRVTLGGESLDPLQRNGDRLEVSLRPWEIATLRIER